MSHDKPPADLPLREHTERALRDYLAHLDGHRPGDLYDLAHAAGNQTRAAEILGINRATLRRKLRELGLAGT